MTGQETGHPLHICCMKEDRWQTAGNQGDFLLVNHQLFVITGTRIQTGFSA
jgi:hypothetical protein